MQSKNKKTLIRPFNLFFIDFLPCPKHIRFYRIIQETCGEPQVSVKNGCYCLLYHNNKSVFEKGFLQDVRHNLWGVQIAGMIFQTGSNFALYRNMFYMNVLLSETKLPEKITFCIIALGSINCFYIAVEHVTKFINLISKHTIYKGHIILHQFLD